MCMVGFLLYNMIVICCTIIKLRVQFLFPILCVCVCVLMCVGVSGGQRGYQSLWSYGWL